MRSGDAGPSLQLKRITKSTLFPGNCSHYFGTNPNSYRFIFFDDVQVVQKSVNWLVKYTLKCVGIFLINY
jgi:hypothetical protein